MSAIEEIDKELDDVAVELTWPASREQQDRPIGDGLLGESLAASAVALPHLRVPDGVVVELVEAVGRASAPARTRHVAGERGIRREPRFRACEDKTQAATSTYESSRRTRRFYRRHGSITLAIVAPYPGWDPGDPHLAR